MPKRLQVLLAPEWYVHEINLGVAQYAHEHQWILHDSLAHTTHRPPENLQFDGIITLLSYPDHFITQKIIARATVPVVDLNGDLPEIQLPRVLPDNEMIGRLAAEHLIGIGFRLLVYYQTSNAVVDTERRDVMIENSSVAAALRHINEHFREDLRAEAIARAAGVSRRSLYRVFQENVGRSVAEEIERRRVFFARQMLVNPELKISDVANESGFVSSGRMAAAFMKHFGKPPSQCRG